MRYLSFKHGGWRVALLILWCLAAASVPGAPSGVAIQGKLTGAGGKALTGTRAWRVQFWNAASGGQALGAPLTGNVGIGASGRFSLVVTPPAAAWSANNLYYELAIDSASTPDGAIGATDVFPGRVKVASVFYAQALARQGAGSGVDADLLDGVHARSFVTTAGLASAGGAAVAWGNLTGVPAPLAALQSGAVMGDITGVAAGAGLEGGGTSGNVTLGVSFAGTGSATTAARSDHAHQFGQLGGTVSDAQVPDSITIDQAKTALRSTTATHALSAGYALAAAEADTLASVTARGAATGAELTLAGGVRTGAIRESQGGAGVRVENVMLRGGTLQFPAVAPPPAMAGQLVNTSSSLYWDGAPLMARTGEAFVIVKTTGNATSNGLNLIAAYRQAQGLRPYGLPLSATNRAVVLVPPGRYDLGTGSLVLDREFVDVVGLSSVAGNQFLFGLTAGPGSGVVRQTANDVHIENIKIQCTRPGNVQYTSSDPACYFPDSNTTQTVVRNCQFEDNNASFCTRLGVAYPGTYENVIALGWADYAFGGAGTASGTFVNCVGGNMAFGGEDGVASGKFLNCIGRDYSFGGHSGLANGIFTNCTGGNYAFGGFGGTASGTFRFCTGGDLSFGGESGIITGTFINCTGTAGAFGGFNGHDLAKTASARLFGCRMTGSQWSGTFAGKMQDCQWQTGLNLSGSARIYRSTFLGTVNLNNTAAGLTQSSAQNITNAANNCFGATNALAMNLANVNVQ